MASEILQTIAAAKPVLWIKARGGIYEVLKHAEYLAVVNDMLTLQSDYALMADGVHRRFFSNYKLIVGSTGNPGLKKRLLQQHLGTTKGV